jgi:predicted HTH domain antitoxin
MTVTIPDDRIGDVRVSEHDALVDIAIGFISAKRCRSGRRAAEIADMPSSAFLHELGRRKIPINYGVEDLRQDLSSPGKGEPTASYE